MSVDIVKSEIEKYINKEVEIKVYGLRSRVETIVGTISNIYPNIFTIRNDKEKRTFRYADIITGEIKVKYL